MDTTKTRPSLKSRKLIFNSLPEQGRVLLETGTVHAVMPLLDWMKVLKALDKLDRECEAGRKASNKVFKYALIPALLSFALPFLNPLYAVGTLVAVIPAIVFYGRARAFAKYDADNRLRLFLMPLLSIMKGEMSKSAEVSVTVNVKKLRDKAFEIGKVPLRKSGNTIGGKDIFYRHDWLDLEMRFLDGTSVQVTITDALRVRKMTKRSMSGKTKYKTKLKTKRKYRVAIKFRTDTYQVKPGGIVTSQTEGYLVVKQKNSRYLANPKDNSDRNLILSGISQAYSQVIPLK